MKKELQFSSLIPFSIYYPKNAKTTMKLLGVLLMLLVFNVGKAQVINESFEAPIWTAVANSITSNSGTTSQVSITAPTASNTYTYFLTQTGSGGTTSVTAASTNTVPNSGVWWYNKASALTSASTRQVRVHSGATGFGLSSGGYLITPVITGGVATVTFWMTSSAPFAIGINTNTTAVQPTYASAGSATIAGYTFATKAFPLSGTAGNHTSAQSFSFTASVTAPCRVGIFSQGSSGITLDDVVIYQPATTPSTQAINVTAPTPTSTSMTVNWTNGNGLSRVVFVKQGSGAITDPVDGTTYTANNDWANNSPTGTQLGASGYYCVYNGIGTSVNLTNMLPSTLYSIQVFEYNGGTFDAASAITTITQKYNTATATGNPATATTAAPTPTIFTSASSLGFSGVKTNTTSPVQSYNLSAVFLSPAAGDITVTAPTGYEVSLASGSGFASSILVPYVSNTLASTPIYVRFSPVALIAYNGNITNVGGSTSTNVAVTGNGSLYNVGDYMTRASGNWGGAATTTWNKWNGSTWAAAATGDFPNLSTCDVYINGGFTVTYDASARNCNNLYITGTSNLVSNLTGGNPLNYLKVYGSTVQVETGSKLGNAQDVVVGNDYDGLSIDVFSSNLTLTGGGQINLARIRTNIGNSTVTMDNDVFLNYHGSADAGNATAYYTVAGDINTLVINAGKTLTFNPWSCMGISSSSHTNGSFSQIINVFGTINFVDGTVPGNATANGFAGHTNGYLSMALASGKTFDLNIKSTGEVNVSELYPQGTKADDSPGVGAGTTNIVIDAGGKLKVSKIADLRSPTQTITGAGEFILPSGSTIKIGASDGLASTGNIQTATKTFNANATYNYAGVAAQTGGGLPATVANLVLDNSAGLTLSAPLTITGSLSDTMGTLTATDITLQGTALQTVGLTGTSAIINTQNLTVDNTSNVTLTGLGQLNVTGVVTTTNGSLASGGLLTLKSSAAGTARIAANSTGVAGTVNVERYIAGNKRAYRFLGHPFNAAIQLSQFADSVDITGAGGTAAGFTSDTYKSPSSAYYNNANGDAALSNDPGWTSYNTSTTETIGVGDGFRLFVRGSKGQSGIFTSPYPTPNAVTIKTRGTLNASPYAKNLAFTANSGYNLISNPFASPVNIKTLALTGAVNTNYWIWDARVGTAGAYLTYTFGAGSDYSLPSSGAFIVKSTAASQSVTFTEADKTATDTSTMLRQNKGVGVLEMTVNADNNMCDRFTMYFNKKGSTAGTDIIFDGDKFRNPEVNFYSLSTNQKALAVDVRPYDDNAVIPLGFTSNKQKTYTVKVSSLNLDENVYMFLTDKYLGVQTKLEQGVEYAFTVDANPASQGENRFELSQKPTPIRKTRMNITLAPNPTTDKVQITYTNEQKSVTTITVTTIDGKMVKTYNVGNVQAGQLTVDTKGLSKGLYNITIVANNTKTTQKLVVE